MSSLQPSPTVYALVMLLAGIGIPIMATLNAGLGAKLNSPALAAIVLFVVALLTATAYLLLIEGLPGRRIPEPTPVHFYLGGLFVAYYVLSVTWVAPRFGIGNAISFVLLGQLLSMATIDQFGLMGAPQTSLSLQRGVGLFLMALGVFLVVRR